MATHRKSRSPLVINIARLGRRPGSMMTFARNGAKPSAHRGRAGGDPRGRPTRTGPADRIRIGRCAGHRNGFGADDGGVRALPHPDHRRCRDRPHRTLRLPRQHDGGDHRRGRSRARRLQRSARLGRPRAGDRRRRRSRAAVLAVVRAGLPRAVPGLRHCDGDCGTRTQAHEKIDPRWAKLTTMLETDDK